MSNVYSFGLWILACLSSIISFHLGFWIYFPALSKLEVLSMVEGRMRVEG